MIMAILVSVKYRLKPGKRDELLSFVMDNVHQTRREPGNLAYLKCGKAYRLWTNT
jgi:quinol monooxygenase YgiN